MAVEPLILLANADKWLTESLESVLTQGGYRVIATAKRAQVLDLARRQQPDGIILDAALDSRASDNLTLCRALRADASISRATPIIVTTAGPALRQQQIEALRAGAWELRGDPLDAEEMLLRLRVYVQGKLEVDRVTGEALVDRASGLYSAAGLARRSEELAAFSARHGLPLSCAVFRVPPGNHLAGAFKQEGRVSDVIGTTGPEELAVFAPATDAIAVARLVERLGEKVGARAQLARPLQAGVSSAPAGTRPDPRALLARARGALEAR
jgi:DNA-binding response OmpR family regulator